MRAGRTRQRRKQVATFERRYDSPLAMPVRGFDQFLCNPLEVGLEQPQIGERVPRMSV